MISGAAGRQISVGRENGGDEHEEATVEIGALKVLGAALYDARPHRHHGYGSD
jgi:hypothetical protein